MTVHAQPDVLLIESKAALDLQRSPPTVLLLGKDKELGLRVTIIPERRFRATNWIESSSTGATRPHCTN